MKKTIRVKKICSSGNSITAVLFGIILMISAAKASPVRRENISGPKKDSSRLISRFFKNSHYSVAAETNQAPTKASISVSNITKRTYQLYLFDTDGKLSAHIYIKNDETISLVNIAKGNYYYEIMCNDESIENGQLSVK